MLRNVRRNSNTDNLTLAVTVGYPSPSGNVLGDSEYPPNSEHVVQQRESDSSSGLKNSNQPIAFRVVIL